MSSPRYSRLRVFVIIPIKGDGSPSKQGWWQWKWRNVSRCDRYLRVNDNKNLRMDWIFGWGGDIIFLTLEIRCELVLFSGKGNTMENQFSKTERREEREKDSERGRERQKQGLKNDTFEVPMRIYLQKFQGRMNRKDTFSLGTLEFSHLAIYKSNNNATLLTQLLKWRIPFLLSFPLLFFFSCYYS